MIVKRNRTSPYGWFRLHPDDVREHFVFLVRAARFLARGEGNASAEAARRGRPGRGGVGSRRP